MSDEVNNISGELSAAGSLLSVRHLKKSYSLGGENIEVLKDVCLELKRGEWLGLLGASGCGKTTLLNIIGMLEPPTSGGLEIGGTAYSAIRCPDRFRNRNIGFIFQNYSLLPELSILENVMLPGMMAGGKRRFLRDRAAYLLDGVGLSGRMKHRPGELSGGEQQRAAVARALINEPLLLLADEPTGNLDEATGEKVLEMFDRLRREMKECTILMITHNPEIADRTDRKVILHNGVLS